MNLFLHFGLLAFLLYFPVLIALVVFAAKRHPNYSAKERWLSDLGDTRSPSYPIFKLMFILYALVFPFLIFGLARLLPLETLSTYIIVFFITFFCGGVSASMLSNNVYQIQHYICVGLVHISVLCYGSLLGYLTMTTELLPKPFIFLNATLLFFAIAFSYCILSLGIRSPKNGISKYAIMKKSSSLLVRYATIIEWGYFFSVIGYCFALGLIAYIHW